ncbi:MAG: EamA family transporter RarD [Campylobacter sp.]|nr:EamA family transporter RarD [Campylobacter sp.]
MLKDNANFSFWLTLSSFFMWSCYPLYFKQFDPSISSIEILIHRIIWSVVFLAIVLFFANKFKEVIALLKAPKTRYALLLSGTLISLNWWIYVYAVANGYLLQTGLGQFLTPLISIILAYFFLNEKISLITKFSIIIVTIVLCVQIYSLGEIPFVGLINSVSFAFYILVHKKVNVSALPALLVETLLLLPFSLVYFYFIQSRSLGHFGANFDSILMMASGIVTIVPLLAFNIGSVKINLTSVAFMQYIIPLMSIGLGVYYGEILNTTKIISFVLIAIAVFMVSIDGIIKRKKR